MARRRFKPDPNFQRIVSEAALGPRTETGGLSGVEGRGRGSVRRTRKTLQSIADDIIEAAKAITDDEEYGLPSVGPGGRRAKGYDFRSEDRKGKTYRASFRAFVARERGRLIVVVQNTHEHAQDVEYGNGPGSIRARGDGYLRVPITMAAYRRIRAEQEAKRGPMTEFQKERARARAKLHYWEGAPARDTEMRRSMMRRLRRLEAGKKSRMSYNQIGGRLNRVAIDLEYRRGRLQAMMQRRNDRYQHEIADARRRLAATDVALQKPNSFAAIGDDGKPYLFTKEVKPYRGYGILRRALTRATYKLE